MAQNSESGYIFSGKIKKYALWGKSWKALKLDLDLNIL